MGHKQILRNFLDEQGRVTRWPGSKNRSLKAEVIEYIANKFEFDRDYTEREVNAILYQWHTFGDHEVIRREMYEMGYMDRLRNGSRYWRTAPHTTFTTTPTESESDEE